MSKKEISVLLSRLQSFESPDMLLEQYPTDSEVAGDALWFANMLGDLDGKVVADLGAGTGILGLGALVLGAKKAYLVDIDPKALELAKANKRHLENEIGRNLNVVFVNSDISSFDSPADVVFMNPPFGTKKENADSVFLMKAMGIAPIIYSFHKASTKLFIDRLVDGNGFRKTHYREYNFPLKKSMPHHKQRIEHIRVGLWRIEKMH
ncbi:MAG: METTL5 family protein [archaeon]